MNLFCVLINPDSKEKVNYSIEII